MNIYHLKARLDQQIQPISGVQVDAEQAWAVFKSMLAEDLDENFCQELGIGFSTAIFLNGKEVVRDENTFQIYFGRLIDAVPGFAWRTAEINFYYRYPMNTRLSSLLSSLKTADFEIAFCKTDSKTEIQQKIETLFAFADGQTEIWRTVQNLTAKASYTFWLT